MKRLGISFLIIITFVIFFIFLYNHNKLKEYSITYNDFDGINIRVYTSKYNKELFDQIEEIIKNYDLKELFDYGNNVIKKTNGYVSIYRKEIDDIFNYSKINKVKPVYKNNNEISYNSIIKSYIINNIKQLIEKYNIDSYIINMKDVSLVGKAHNSTFTIGIQKPFKIDEYLTLLNLNNKAVSTVGPYQNYFVLNDNIYHNLINLKTLKQEDNYKSITVIGDDILEVHMLSNYLYFLSIEEGKEILKQYNYDGIWYTNENELIFTNDFK